MLDGGLDQAAGLRWQAAQLAPAILAVPLAAGESCAWIAQLAHSLRAAGSRPVVLDAVGDGMLTRAFGLGNPRADLIDMLTGTSAFDQVSQATTDGVHVLRAERGVEAFVASCAPPHQLFGGFARLSHGFDTLLLAMPPRELACLASPVRSVPIVSLQAGDRNIMNTYSMVKQLAADFGYRRFALVAHGHVDAMSAQCAHGRFAAAVGEFLGAHVLLAGRLPMAGAPPEADLRGLAATLLATATPIPRTGSPD